MHKPPQSYFSTKVKIDSSFIHGKGLIATEDIYKDEIVGIKDGYIIGKDLLKKIGGLKNKVGEAMLQIADDFFLGPTQESE
ncbi:MAG: hypothetical protein HYT64_00610, partial [Candidatus Yanofskybacteria bacterium]|nr:hypothetical protein [Candidatus Yanofskybacteria bacterium]